MGCWSRFGAERLKGALSLPVPECRRGPLLPKKEIEEAQEAHWADFAISSARDTRAKHRDLRLETFGERPAPLRRHWAWPEGVESIPLLAVQESPATYTRGLSLSIKQKAPLSAGLSLSS